MDIITIDFIILIVLVVGIRDWQKKHGPLTGKRIALIVMIYFTLFILTTLYPVIKTFSNEVILYIVLFLLVLWGVGYPWVYWLHKKFTQPK